MLDLDPNIDTVLRWTCPSCHAEWLDRGRGFHGQRFSPCLACGVDVCEPLDTRPALAPHPVYVLTGRDVETPPGTCTTYGQRH